MGRNMEDSKEGNQLQRTTPAPTRLQHHPPPQIRLQHNCATANRTRVLQQLPSDKINRPKQDSLYPIQLPGTKPNTRTPPALLYTIQGSETTPSKIDTPLTPEDGGTSPHSTRYTRPYRLHQNSWRGKTARYFAMAL